MQLVEREAARQLAQLDIAPVDNPLAELAALAGRARAWMNLMQDRVDVLLAAGSPADDGTDSEGGIRYRAGAGEQLRAEVALYERAMDRLGRFLTAFAQLGIDERLARISEQQAALVVQAIRGVLDDLNLTPEQRAMVPQVVPRRLRELSGSTA